MSEDHSDSKSIDDLANLLLGRKNSRKGRIIIFAGAAISMHTPSCLPVANQMLEETIRVLLEDKVLKATLQKAFIFDKLYRFINDSIKSRIIPPEMIYDSIYEYAGNKVFRALDCLKSNHPNLNHKILANLLDKGFADHIITTNFDSLIEQSLPKQSLFSLSSAKTRVWKIHGDIHSPRTIATTIRCIGQAAFNNELVDRLKGLLEGSHVLFIGYSGADPDLMPAFVTATMESVYWCVYKSEELNPEKEKSIINKDPCKTIQANKTPITWIVGDLQEELLVPIAEKLDILSTSSQTDVKDFKGGNLPLEGSMTKWEEDEKEQLSPVEKALAILQILYNIALYSSEPIDVWIVLIETANAMAEDPALSNYFYSEFRRDLHAFQAEAYLKLGEFVQQLHTDIQIQSLVKGDIQLDFYMLQVEPYLEPSDLAQQLDDSVTKLRHSSLKIDGSIPNQIGELFVRAKEHLTTIIPLNFQDAVQVQALLNASTILVSLASSRRSKVDESRNMQGAEKGLMRGIKICQKAKMNPEKRYLLEARCYSNLAVIRIWQGRFKNGLYLFGKAEKLFKKSGNLYSYIVTCINTGLLFMNLNRLEDANRFSKKAKNVLHSFPNTSLEEKTERLEKELSQKILAEAEEKDEK